MAQRIRASEARKDFKEVIERAAGGQRIKLTRYGRTLAVLVGKSDLATLEDCENQPDRKRSGQSG
jgi:prevent-host-death family protein